MTNSTPDIPILDDDAVARIERESEMASPKDVRALCQTVRVLRAENERLKDGRMIVRDDAEQFIQQYLHSAQWEGETLMIKFENEALIAALIGDVK